MIVLQEAYEFQWDEGNQKKNWDKHGITAEEAEEAFFDPNKQEYPDPTHSEMEERKVIAGRTRTGRLLFVVFTFRGQKVRIISARDLNRRKESDLYEKAPYFTEI